MSMKDKTSSLPKDFQLSDLFMADFKPKLQPQLKPKPKAKAKKISRPRAPRPSPWIPQARIFYTSRISYLCCDRIDNTCDCQGPLVRFQHKRQPTTFWEIADHTQQFNQDLEKILVETEDTRPLCSSCFMQTEQDFQPIIGAKYAQEHQAQKRPPINEADRILIFNMIWRLPQTPLLTYQPEQQL